MAEPFDTIGASFADVIDRLARGEITEAQAGALLAPLLAATNDGEFGARVQEIIGVMGRVTGTLIVEAPPSNLLGAPGSNAWDRVHKVFYGPKDALTGWPPGDSMTQGPPGPKLQLQVSATHIQWRVEGAATWNNLIALSALEGADGQQVSLQKSATHVQWRLGAGAWTDLIPLADLRGNTGLTPDIAITAATGAPGSDVVVSKAGTPEAPTFTLTIPRGAIGLTPNLTAQIAMVAHGEPAVVTRSGPDSAPVLTFSIPSPLDGEDGSEIELQSTPTHIQWRRLGDTGWIDLLAIADLKVKGDKGEAFTFDAQPADLAGRAAFDSEGPDFTVLVMDTGMVYSRVGLTPGVWSDGFPFGQTQNDILVALSELNTATGVLVQTGDATFAKRPIGAAADGDILDRISADGRYRRQGVNVPMAEVDGLSTALGGKADAAAVLTALGGKQDALGFPPEDASKKGAANGYAGLDADGKVPEGQLPTQSGGGLEVGDILTTARAPGAKYLLADGSSYLRSAWPALSPLLPDGGSVPFTTWIARTLPSGGLWTDMIFAGGQFVALRSVSATCLTSSDGVTWTSRTLPVSAQWRAVAYGNGRYVAVAASGAICATSPDGITWTQRALPTTTNWGSIAFGAGVFVALSVSNNTTICATSPDGETWTQRALPVTQEWKSVVFGGGVFVAVGGISSAAATSPDGINWTERILPSAGIWASVTYGDGQFLAITSGRAAATSFDGVAWTARTLPAPLSSDYWYRAGFGRGLFVLVGGAGSAAISPDGVAWTSIALPGSTAWNTIAYGSGVFVALAYVANSTSSATSNKLTDATLFRAPLIASNDLSKAYIKGEA